jgi:hypothetical protein
MLKQRKLGNVTSVLPTYTKPAILVDQEINTLQEITDISTNTLFFLEEMQDMIDEQSTHREQLMIILNISKSLWRESSTSLQAKGLDKQQIAQILYQVMLKYLVNVMPGIDISTSNEKINVQEMEVEKDIIQTTESDEEITTLIEAIFAE